MTIIPAAVSLPNILEEKPEPDAVATAACAIVIGVGVVGLTVQTAMLILRFVNIGLINMKFRIFGIIVS